MGIVLSHLTECLCAPGRKHYQNLEERIEELELRAEHSQALGLCCAGPSRQSREWR